MQPVTGGAVPEPRQKIKNLDDLAPILAELRAQGRRIVHCHGVFDLVHIGHVRHFEQAKRFGDVLVVTLTPDKWVNKGPHRPAFPEELRLEMLATLTWIDYVAVNRWPTAVETIKLLRPNCFVKGSEFKGGKDVTGAIQVEEDAIRSVGGEIVFTEDVIYSSSNLINRHMSRFTKAGAEFLEDFGRQHTAESIQERIDALKGLKVLVVGEAMVDEYHYCRTLGKGGKEPILAVRFESSERFPGGNLAVANHVASFCEQVRLLTFLGSEDRQEDFIRSRLNPRIQPEFFTMAQAPTIVKRRFVESYPFQKLFEVDYLKDHDSVSVEAERFRDELRRTLPQYDVVIVTDYGHGMLDREVVDLLCARAPLLAVHTQVNAGNQGFNTITKYRRADFVCLSEHEARLEARQPQQDLERIVTNLADRLDCRKMLVTQGNSGAMCFTRGRGFVRVPAFTTHFVDRMGAGEAVFAITSLLAAQDTPPEVLGLVGNAVGAMAVEVVGNRTSIERTPLLRFIVSLLK